MQKKRLNALSRRTHSISCSVAIYVQPFPPTGAKYLVSAKWRALYYERAAYVLQTFTFSNSQLRQCAAADLVEASERATGHEVENCCSPCRRRRGSCCHFWSQRKCSP